MANNVNKDDRFWHGPQGSDDLGKDKLRKDESGRKYPEPKSIVSKVERNAGQDDGFSGKLTSDE